MTDMYEKNTTKWHEDHLVDAVLHTTDVCQRNRNVLWTGHMLMVQTWNTERPSLWRIDGGKGWGTFCFDNKDLI